MVAYTLFWHALLPQFEGVALSHLAARGGDYTRVRLWGSIGFIVAVLGLGMLLERTGTLALPWLVAVFWLGMAISTWLVPEPPQLAPTRSAAASSLTRVMPDPGVIALLLIRFRSPLIFATYFNFLPLFR